MVDSKKFRVNFKGNDVAGIEFYVNQLMSSIKERGLLKPLVVKPKIDGKYKVSGGNHRAEALKRLGKKMIPCKIQRGQV